MNNYPDVAHPAAGSDEISLAELVSALYERRWLIVSSTFVASLVAAAIALSMTPIYRAEVLLSPVVDGDKKGGISALAGQFGGLAALADVNLGGNSSKAEAFATLASRALTEKYIQSRNLMPVLFEKKWDAEKQDWNASLKKKPKLWDGGKFFMKSVRKVSEDKKTGLVTLSIEWKNADTAALWANELVMLTNQTLRDQAISRSNRNLAYLNDQLEKTSVVELRQAIYRLLEAEVKNVMVASGNDEYAFKVIDPAVAPQEKAKPKRTLMVIVGAMLGFVLSCGIALVSPRRTRST